MFFFYPSDSVFVTRLDTCCNSFCCLHLCFLLLNFHFGMLSIMQLKSR